MPDSCPFCDQRQAWFQNPGAPAVGALRGLGQLGGIEFKATFAAASGFDDRDVFGVLETFEQMQQIGLDVARRFADQPGDLGDGQCVVQQQRDEVFAEHAASRPHGSSEGENGANLFTFAEGIMIRLTPDATQGSERIEFD